MPYLSAIFIKTLDQMNDWFGSIPSFLLAANGEVKNLGDIELVLAIIGSIIALFSFFRVGFYQKKRYLIEKSKYATDMIKEWNINSATDTNIIQMKFNTYYNECIPIPLKDVEENILSDKDFRDSVKRLFNYFEYVATAYYTSADKKIVEKSFSLTIIRYVQMLENYLLYQLYYTKRNHWIPVTEYILDQVKSQKYLCKLCDKNQKDCFMISKEYLRLLNLFNKEIFAKDEIIEIETIYQKRVKMVY